MNADLKRTLTSTLGRSLVWTLALAAATAQGPGGPELNVAHYKAPEFPVAGPVSDESALPSSSHQIQVPAPSASSTEWINSSPLFLSLLWKRPENPTGSYSRL
jgi:hypothetical protein